MTTNKLNHPVKTLILASASPRRSELLRWAGLDFEIHPGEVDETTGTDESPRDYVLRLALAKADKVAAVFPDSWVLSADTSVVAGGQILGKPQSHREARKMLQLLAGRPHQVITGVCLLNKNMRINVLKHVTTRVRFRALTEDDIERYIASGEVWDKAGAYAIQGQGAAMIHEIEGSYTNVIGLPIEEVIEILRHHGALPQ
jgi:septum formation protein